jgi:surface antigen
MRERKTGGAFVTLGSVFIAGFALVLGSPDASAASAKSRASHGAAPAHHATRLVSAHGVRPHALRARGVGGGLQCVTFARASSGIELAGNAADWWTNAAGVYERGSRPEAGSVLNFRANGRMRLGHVSVVSDVIGPRLITVDHANWAYGPYGRGSVTRSVHVVDVSPNNDWSAVRVELGHSGNYGSIYPAYGFIYGRPDGTPAPRLLEASATPVPALNPAPTDLRPLRERAASPLPVRGFDQVAEMPGGPIDFSLAPSRLTFDAPDRSLR